MRSRTSRRIGPTAWPSCAQVISRSGIPIFLRGALPRKPASSRALSAALAADLDGTLTGVDLVGITPRLAGRRFHVHLCAPIGRAEFAGLMAGWRLFGLGGFTLAKIENINQLNGWPGCPPCRGCSMRRDGKGWRQRVRWGVALALVIALQLLAGHTQTAFINLVGLGVYAVWPVGRLVYWYIGRLVERRRSGLSDSGITLPLPVSRSPALPLSRRPPPTFRRPSGVRSRRRSTTAIAGAECVGAASRRAALPAGSQLFTAAEIACADPATADGWRPQRSVRQRGLR